MNSIDFRITRWGHNFSVIDNDGNGTLKFFTWSTPRPSAGDEIIWNTPQGHCIAKVKESRSMVGVIDMCKITVEVIDRYWKDGKRVENFQVSKK